MAAIDDAHCTSCHAQLPNHTKGGATELQKTITTFAAGGAHPPFGRTFRDKSGAIVDPTVLKFNHALHLFGLGDQSKSLSCATCHSSSDANPLSYPPLAKKDATPTQTDRDAPLSWGNERNRAYMRPIRYASHCAACHPLNLYAGGPVVAHTDLPLVRAQLTDVKRLIAQQLASAAATTEPASAEPALPGAEQKDPVDAALETLDGEVSRKLPADHKSEHPSTQPALLEYYVARVGSGANSCFLCHVVEGDSLAAPAGGPSTRPVRTIDGKRIRETAMISMPTALDDDSRPYPNAPTPRMSLA